MNNKLIFLFGIIFLLGIVSAGVNFDEDYGTYGGYKITSFFPTWLGGGGTSNYNLLDNTASVINCMANLEVYNELPHNLIDDINFIGKNGEDLSDYILSLRFEIGTYQDVEKTNYSAPIYSEEQTCEDIFLNETNTTEQNCYFALTGYETYTEEELVWEEYNGEEVQGYAQLKILVERSPLKPIDWIITFRGEELAKWAWWNSSWNYKRQINITETSGSTLNNYSTLIYVPYDSDMQADFDDLRFTNDAEDTELNYWIENKSDGNYAYVWVKIPTLTASSITSIYMYYGNISPVITTSSFNNAFVFADDFESSLNANWLQKRGTWSTTGGYLTKSTTTDDIIVWNASLLNLSNYTVTVNMDNSAGAGWEGVAIRTNNNADYYSIQKHVDNKVISIEKWLNNAFSSALVEGTSTTTENINITAKAVGTNISFYENGVYKISTTDGALSSGSVGIVNYQTIKGKFYWIKVQPYTSVEPTYTIGAEQQSAGIINIEFVTPPTPENNSNLSVPYIPVEVEIDYTNATLDNITYNFYKGGVLNASYFYDNETLFVNHTGCTCANWQFNVTACYTETISSTSNCVTTETREVTIDILPPSINITSPLTSYDYLYDNQTLDLNYSVVDASDHLDSCWYNYNGAITNLNCSENITLNYIIGNNNITLYANDTFGNVGNLTRSWWPIVTQQDIYYENETYEGENNLFQNQVLINGTLTNAYMNYAGTNYTSSIIDVGDTTILYNYLTIPDISIETNNTFYWYLLLDDIWTTSIENNQTVYPITITNCSKGTLLNLTLLDEKTQTSINGTIEVLFNIISSTNLTVETFNQSFNNTQQVNFCTSLNESEFNLFKLDGQIKYYSDNYSSELYNIQNSNLTNFPTSIYLYDILTEESTTFKITYKGDDFIIKEGVLVQLLRKYISEDSYKVVEAPITNSLGEVVLHVDLDSNIYNIIVSKDGEVLDTYENIVFICDNQLASLCKFNLDGVIDPYSSIALEELRDITYSISQINDSYAMVVFSTSSGTPANVNLFVEATTITGQSTVYNNTVYTSAGSFLVPIDSNTSLGIGNNVYDFQISKDDEVIGLKQLLLNNNGIEWDNNNYFIVVLLLLSLVFMAVSSPEFVIFNAILTFVLAGGLWLVNGMNFVVGLGNLIWLVIAGGILIYKLASQEDR
jgi:hypothetical protein